MTRALVVCLALAGCGQPGGTAPADAPTAPSDVPPDARQDDLGGVDLPEDEPIAARQLKRMTIAQVRDSMERITGGVAWGDPEESKWDRYADTLGVADYQLRMEADRTPSVMFQKFLDDAATETCVAWVEGEGDHAFFAGEVPEPTDRAALVSQVSALRWAIQGRPRTDRAVVVDDVVTLFTTVHQRTGDSTLAWQTVCVALFTHPDFFLY